MDVAQILLSSIFYVIMFMIYRYSKAKYYINDEVKKEHYLEWVGKYGATASRSCIMLSIIYTAAFIFRILSY